MNKHLFNKVFLLLAVACTVVLLLDTNALAASKDCSIIGSWIGGFGDGSGNDWMIIMMRGSSATTGPFSVEWPGAGGVNPVGVWEKVDAEHYKFTFIWGLDANGAVGTARTSGMITLLDCDHTEETWATEFWLTAQDMNAGLPPAQCHEGTSAERRIPVVQATCDCNVSECF
jgi:hypothetical protein